ncbi:MAG: divalent-cation tolerance protein CutA [Candidatus Omnitrophica bacterium]|nr:divalent-cation tolerance protein CutA [Candidatus Omnitrophota bacterium]
MLRKPYVVFSTVGSLKEAKKIASVLVHQKLAACVNVIPNVHSLFRWQGKVDQAQELLLVIKTDFRHLKDLEKNLRKHHSYEVPEIVGWPIAWGSKPYLSWLGESLKS